MSLAAAIGYVIGIMIFAIFFRLRRRKMRDSFIQSAHSKITNSDKGSQND